MQVKAMFSSINKAVSWVFVSAGVLALASVFLSAHFYRSANDHARELRLARHVLELRGADRVIDTTSAPQLDIEMSVSGTDMLVSVTNTSTEKCFVSPLEFIALNRSSAILFFDEHGDQIMTTPIIMYDRMDESDQRLWQSLEPSESIEVSADVVEFGKWVSFSRKPRFAIGHIIVRYASTRTSAEVKCASAVFGPFDLDIYEAEKTLGR